MPSNSQSYDVTIIGAGLAGIALALSLDPRLKVGIFCKSAQPGGASSWAQGGMATVVTADDSFAEHANDTILAGGGLCNLTTVNEIIAGGPKALTWLENLKIPFTRGESGKLDLAREGGHRKNRIVHASDATGAAILDTIIPQLKQRDNITVCPNSIAIDLIVRDSRVCGFYMLERDTGKVHAISAGCVALATGGAGKVYRYTTNPRDSTGDGIAMAWRAGCPVVNMEFVQFHPTALYHSLARAVLISEAVRGAGALLVDKHGNRFMPSYHPDAELAPRDIVARAIDAHMKKTGADCVYLDFSPLDKSTIQKRFPSITQSCLKLGLDITSELIPVVPSAHYLCGGIESSPNGQTSIDNLYALGETAYTGLHGANRLASNSLLECIVVALAAADQINSRNLSLVPDLPAWDSSRVGPAHEEVMVTHNWNEIRSLMWNYVGIVRSDERLKRARHRLEIIAEEVGSHYRHFVLSPDFIELRNLLLCAKLIVRSAASRKESRGLHFNQDWPVQLPSPSPTILKPTNTSTDDIVEVILHAT